MSMYFRCIGALSRTLAQVKLFSRFLCSYANDQGYGTGFSFLLSAHHLHRFSDSYQGHASLVSLDQLSQSGWLCLRITYDK